MSVAVLLQETVNSELLLIDGSRSTFSWATELQYAMLQQILLLSRFILFVFSNNYNYDKHRQNKPVPVAARSKA